MKTRLLFAFLLMSFAASAQYTLIPDINFEKRLIDINIDSGTPDGKVLTANINSVQFLDVTHHPPFSKISSLTGIESFTALTTLVCGFNALITLDVSKNAALSVLYCSSNQLITLDVSKNAALTELYCSYNQLTSLNVKNGANSNLVNRSFQYNPNLICIQVDDKTYSDINWFAAKDATASYNTVCSALGVNTNEIVFGKMSIYPNPTKGELHIDNVTLEKATVYDASGKLVKLDCFEKASDKNTLNLNGLGKGVYYLFIESEGAQTAEKIVIE